MPNADLSREDNTPVQVNETYTVTCKRGHEIYNEHNDSFVGGQHNRLRSVTVQNVHGILSMMGRNFDGFMDKLICTKGTSW